jgi:hypothetical protein
MLDARTRARAHIHGRHRDRGAPHRGGDTPTWTTRSRPRRVIHHGYAAAHHGVRSQVSYRPMGRGHDIRARPDTTRTGPHSPRYTSAAAAHSHGSAAHPGGTNADSGTHVDLVRGDERRRGAALLHTATLPGARATRRGTRRRARRGQANVDAHRGFRFFPSRRHADRFALAKTSPTCANPTVLPRPEGPAGNLQRPHSCREGHEQGLGRPATEGLDDLCVRL